ncbi:hypothetical protein KVV02_003868, partial [Mortierella alpina]
HAMLDNNLAVIQVPTSSDVLDGSTETANLHKIKNMWKLSCSKISRVVEDNLDHDVSSSKLETQVVAPGIWGLFGNFKDQLDYSVTTTADKYSTGSDYIDVRVLSPTKSVKESQILIKSIPGALGDWGGVFSTLWGIFYFFFGQERLDPFGIFTVLFIRRKTRRNLIEGREKGKADDGDNGDNGDRGDRWNNGYGNMASDPTLYVPLTTSTEGGLESMNGIVQRQGEHIRKIEEDFYNLRRLLKDYYLDIDLVSRASTLMCRPNSTPTHAHISSFDPQPLQTSAPTTSSNPAGSSNAHSSPQYGDSPLTNMDLDLTILNPITSTSAILLNDRATLATAPSIGSL